MPDESAAPIDRLPPEVLIGIFQCAIDTTYNLWNMRYSVALTLTLCSVCSRWRDLTIGNNHFWSRIPVGNGPLSGPLTELFLGRSQDSPLIDVVAFARYTLDKGSWKAEEELRPHIHRIRSLSIVTASFQQVYQLLALILTDRVPSSLIHLSLMAKPELAHLPKLILVSWPYQQNFIDLCNQLQTLELNNVWTDFNSYSFDRLEKLSLDVNNGFLGTLYPLLPAARNLRFLEIGDTAAYAWTLKERTDPEFVHGAKVLRLREPYHFCLWEQEGIFDSKNWDIIDFHLSWSLTDGSTVEIRRKLDSLDPFMRVHSSNITLFTLRNDQPEVLERISSILQLLPNLHTLTFEGLELTDSILSLFIPPESSGAFPKFRTLRLLRSTLFYIDTFKALISSHPIQRLDLWRSWLEWDNGEIAHRPTGYSPFYEWLCEQVPELYIRNRI